MKIKIIVTLLFTLALKFNVIAVENEKKTAESVFSVAKADVLKAEMKGLSLSESTKLVKMAIKDAKAFAIIGYVKFFNDDKGYGFIAPEGGGNDVFVHISVVERAGLSTLLRGQKVSFELEQDKRGKMMAVNLKLLD